MPGDEGGHRCPPCSGKAAPAACSPASEPGSGVGQIPPPPPPGPPPAPARPGPAPPPAARRPPPAALRRGGGERARAGRPHGFSFSPGRARGGRAPDARRHREAVLSLSCVKTSSANWLTLNGETGRTTHVFHFGFESQKTGFLQKPFGFNKYFCIRSRSKGLYFQVLREYLKLDSKAGFITNSDVEEGYSFFIWMLLSKFLQPWHKNIRPKAVCADSSGITERQSLSWAGCF
ncbi:unnamed protein product [Nyctereutes procyonoides]|uniref:(raccoon dog) hypothetical protein n=1 Tax=Nyctereutes procyonoides TaxID=34880 RepID=A0A811ZJE0_NYCPR|nr:unnamed protein product [Nyctereutes procyonoides]